MSGDIAWMREKGNTVGWLVAAVILLVVFVAAAGLWFTFHP